MPQSVTPLHEIKPQIPKRFYIQDLRTGNLIAGSYDNKTLARIIRDSYSREGYCCAVVPVIEC